MRDMEGGREAGRGEGGKRQREGGRGGREMERQGGRE